MYVLGDSSVPPWSLRGSQAFQRSVSLLVKGYLETIRATSRIVYDPPDLLDQLDKLRPAILVSWHGQTSLMPLIIRKNHPYHVLIARHADGDIIADVCRRYGVTVTRGSNAKRGRAKNAGAAAIRTMVRALKSGQSIGLTADAPKIARAVAVGALLVSSLSRRPIVPIAAVASRRFDFVSWDRASLAQPFGACAFCIGEPLWVPHPLEEDALDYWRGRLEAELDSVHAKAFGLIRSKDPGFDLRANRR